MLCTMFALALINASASPCTPSPNSVYLTCFQEKQICLSNAEEKHNQLVQSANDRYYDKVSTCLYVSLGVCASCLQYIGSPAFTVCLVVCGGANYVCRGVVEHAGRDLSYDLARAEMIYDMDLATCDHEYWMCQATGGGGSGTPR